MGNIIKLGDIVRDTITGFSGTATAMCEYIEGYTKVRVTGLSIEGKEAPDMWLDERRLAVVSP